MPLVRTDRAGAFSLGHTLWIIATPQQSHWAQLIDWELGFQITRAEHFQETSWAKPLEEIVQACALPRYDDRPDKSAPLMIASHHYLPNTFTVCLPFSEKAKWVKEINEIWEKLKFPTLRVFLPDNLKFEAVEDAWDNPDHIQDVSIVAS